MADWLGWGGNLAVKSIALYMCISFFCFSVCIKHTFEKGVFVLCKHSVRGMGHPEMCTRPCLFFSAGQCQNRSNCDFCHLPHTRRPTHLDKRNRELLRSLSNEEKLATILPILREKLRNHCHNPRTFDLLTQLEASATPDALEAFSTTSSKQVARGERTLKSALRAVTLRSLLTMLLRMLPREHLARHIIEAMIQSLRSAA